MTPTVIQGPARGVGVPQSNVIPGAAEMVLDVRLTPGIDADGIHASFVEAMCRKAEGACPGAKVEWEAINSFRLATRVDKSEALVQAMIGGVKAGAGRSPRYGGFPARPTARF